MQLTLMDHDVVELSNLPRQVLFTEEDLGMNKAEAAARKLRTIAPHAQIDHLNLKLTRENAHTIVAASDFVIDAVDDAATKFLISDACVALNRAYSYGGAVEFSGQTMTVLPGKTACLRCVFEAPPDPEETVVCRDGGILGPVAGLIGACQGREAVRFATGQALLLTNNVLSYQGFPASRIRRVTVRPRLECGCAAAGLQPVGRDSL